MLVICLLNNIVLRKEGVLYFVYSANHRKCSKTFGRHCRFILDIFRGVFRGKYQGGDTVLSRATEREAGEISPNPRGLGASGPRGPHKDDTQILSFFHHLCIPFTPGPLKFLFGLGGECQKKNFSISL